jgi:hypothetical protein
MHYKMNVIWINKSVLFRSSMQVVSLKVKGESLFSQLKGILGDLGGLKYFRLVLKGLVTILIYIKVFFVYIFPSFYLSTLTDTLYSTL